jgi:hypothetical protein
MSEAGSPPRVHLVLRQQRAVPTAARWLYLGEDYPDMLEWQRRLGAEGRIRCGERLEAVRRRLRQPYLEWLAAVGRRFAGQLEWAISPLASRSPLLSPLFLDLCYLEIAAEAVEERGGDLLVVCHDFALLQALEQKLGGSANLRRVPGWRRARWREAVWNGLRQRTRWPRAGAAQLRRTLALRRRRGGRRPQEPSGPVTLVQTFATADTPQADPYWGLLPEWLRRQGETVLLTPLPGPARNQRAVLRQLQLRPAEFLILEDRMRLADWWRARRVMAGAARRVGDLAAEAPPPQAALLRRERQATDSCANALPALLYGMALARWLRSPGRVCTRYLGLWEGAFWEKPFLSVLRSQPQRPVLIGYQHSTAPSELMAHAVSLECWSTELNFDFAVTTGSADRDQMIAQGFPAAKLAAGPALRYPGGIADAAPAEPGGAGRRLLLTPLSYQLSAVVEMLQVLMELQSFLQAMGAEVVLKRHPMLAAPRLARLLPVGGIPEGWRWADDKLAQLLASSTVMLGTATSAHLDAALHGVPVVVMTRELGFSYNPLTPWSGDFVSARGVVASGLRQRLETVFADPAAAAREARALAGAVRSGLGAVDPAHLAVFQRRTASMEC